jgi:hypothetical protein
MEGRQMAGKNEMVRPTFVAPPMQQNTGPVERYRPRSPAEVVDDSYTAVVQATALNTVTHMAYDSVRTVVEHKNKLLADHPEMEAELNALGFNHVQGLMAIQRQVTDNQRTEKS